MLMLLQIFHAKGANMQVLSGADPGLFRRGGWTILA